MKKMIFIAIQLLAAMAFAEGQSLQVAPGSNYFDTVESWFHQGTPVTFKQMQGFYAGRCFDVNAKTKPLGAALGYATVTPDEDAGPGFPVQSHTKLIVVTFQNINGFEDADHYQTNKADIVRVLRQQWSHTTEYSETPTLHYFGDWEPNGNMDDRYDIVSYNNYLIVKYSAAMSQKYGNEIGYKNAGDTIGMCYFFRKMGN